MVKYSYSGLSNNWKMATILLFCSASKSNNISSATKQLAVQTIHVCQPLASKVYDLHFDFI